MRGQGTLADWGAEYMRPTAHLKAASSWKETTVCLTMLIAVADLLLLVVLEWTACRPGTACGLWSTT